MAEKQRILIVDDDENIADLISLYLTKECFETQIVGDGESNEGQVWEAFSFAAAKKLSNLVVLLDWNKRQLDGWTADTLPMGDYVAKFNAFGFDTVIVNGNDVEALADALERTRNGGDKPFAIVMDTVKGAGVPEVEQTEMNHSIPVNDERAASR